MNRQMRRKAQKGANVDSAGREGVALGMIVSFAAMRDELGIGKERAKRIEKRIMDYVDSINRNYITINDLQKMVEDEMGVSL